MASGAFIEHEITKDVISTPPNELLSVEYDNGVEVNLGNVLTPTQVKNKPRIKWNAESDTLYTLVMIDPDVPTRANPAVREISHWLVVNIPGNDISKGDVLSEFIGSGPSKDSGLHRYIFFVFKQNGKIEDKEHAYIPNTSAEGRAGWKTAEFAAKHGLGGPLFGNFYQAEFDDYVPILHKQLGF